LAKYLSASQALPALAKGRRRRRRRRRRNTRVRRQEGHSVNKY